MSNELKDFHVYDDKYVPFANVYGPADIRVTKHTADMIRMAGFNVRPVYKVEHVESIREPEVTEPEGSKFGVKFAEDGKSAAITGKKIVLNGETKVEPEETDTPDNAEIVSDGTEPEEAEVDSDATDAEDELTNLEDKTVKELKAILDDMKVDYNYKDTKPVLIDLVQSNLK